MKEKLKQIRKDLLSDKSLTDYEFNTLADILIEQAIPVRKVVTNEKKTSKKIINS